MKIKWNKVARLFFRISGVLSGPPWRFAMYCERRHNPYFPSPSKEHKDCLDGLLNEEESRKCFENGISEMTNGQTYAWWFAAARTVRNNRRHKIYPNGVEHEAALAALSCASMDDSIAAVEDVFHRRECDPPLWMWAA